MTNYIKLKAWHEDDNGRVIQHVATTLADGPPRRFVTRWEEDGPWAMSIVERQDGFFAGLLEHEGEAFTSARGTMTSTSDGWEMTIEVSHDGDMWRWVIHTARLGSAASKVDL